MLKHEGLKLNRNIFFCIITSQILNINMKLSMNLNTKRHGNEKTTQSDFSLNITKWFVNNHQQK